MVSFISPARNTESYPKPKKSMSVVDTSLEVSSMVLTTLQDAARFAPVPYLQEAAGLALSIVNMVATTKDNREAFRMVANDACELVCVVIGAVRLAQGKGNIEEESDLLRNIRQLIDTLTNIDNFARKESNRNVVTRFVRYQHDMTKIQNFRRTLQKSLDIFGLQSNISMSESLNRIAQQQTELLTAKKSEEVDTLDREVKRREETKFEVPSAAENKRSGRQNISQTDPAIPLPLSETPPPSPPPNPFAHFTPNFKNFDPFSSTSNIKYTVISGNMNEADNSNNISNSNSGNTTTTTITDAYNDSSYRNYGGRVGGRDARGPRHHRY